MKLLRFQGVKIVSCMTVQKWTQLSGTDPRERATLPFFCCLGRIANQQQPAVLLFSWASFRKSRQTVKCHVLKPWQPIANDFAYTVVSKPPLCNMAQDTCNCALLHCELFPIQNILHPAVVKGANNLHRSLFCKFNPSPAQPNLHLIHMTMSKDSVECFAKYSEKRLKYFNDFFLINPQENAVNNV
jgi:hypothetical protein